MADMDDAPPEADEASARNPSKLDESLQMRLFKSWFRDDASHSAIWRREAKEDFDFVAGEQWTADEKSQLNDGMRPEIVFNRSITIIKAVAGFEINGRHEIQFLPRNTQDTAVNEDLTGVSKWMSDECDGEDEESDAFQDSLVCGMGWCENVMEYEEDPQGKYVEREIYPLEMYWDYSARKKNLSDARRMARLRKIALADAREEFPGFSDVELDATWAVGIDPEEETKTLEERRHRTENQPDNFTERHEVNIVHMQWWEREVYWIVADPQTNTKIDLTNEKYLTLKKRMALISPGFKLIAAKMKRRKYKQAFLGKVPLEIGDAPCPDQFSFKCITGEAKKNKGLWYGLIRIMRDPQKWGNKWLSQTLHIMNSTAKGGILAEAGMFEDQRQAETSWAKSDTITWAAKGALSNGTGARWAAKPQTEFPAGFFQLLEFAISSLRDVTGINLELLGQKDINQPGILEAQRKQAGMTVLATMFDSLRRFRKQTGRIRLYFMQNFLSDGRLVRIVGPQGAKVIPLIKDKTTGEYDVHVDDAPTSPNQKEANWAVIAPLIPLFKDQLVSNPALMASILDFSPLPSRMVEIFKQVLLSPNPDGDQQKKLMIAKIVAGINKDQSTAEMQDAKAGATQATAAYDLAMAHHLLTGPQALDGIKKQAEIENLRAKTLGEHANTAATVVGAQSDAAGGAADAALSHASATHERIKAMVAGMQPIAHSDPQTGADAMPPPAPVGASQ